MTTFTLENLTPTQCSIADTLWTCNTQAEVQEAVERGGIEYAKIYSLMIAASFDNVPNTEMAMEVLSKY